MWFERCREDVEDDADAHEEAAVVDELLAPCGGGWWPEMTEQEEELPPPPQPQLPAPLLTPRPRDAATMEPAAIEP